VRIPLSVPYLGDDDRRAVVDALDSGWVSSAGPMLGRFEEAVAATVGVRRGVATNSGTAAIHLALLALGIGKGDLVIVTPLTFIATVNPIYYCGASPLFVDVDPSDGSLSVSRLREYLEAGTIRDGDVTKDRATGAPVRAILPVHLYGLPADMASICRIAQDFGIAVIEDATEALGSRLDGIAAGAFGKLSCLSFNGNKIITTGGGGMVLTNDDDLSDRCRYLGTQARDDPLEYLHHEVGYNYRLNNLQAALGLAQLSDLRRRLEHKRGLARQYRKLLVNAPLRFLEPRRGAEANHWLTAVVLDDASRRKSATTKLAEHGIEVRPFFAPVHHQRPYRKSRRWQGLKVADALYDAGLNLPSSISLTEADVAEVSTELQAALE
jgi:perosamine synthetase